MVWAFLLRGTWASELILPEHASLVPTHWIDATVWRPPLPQREVMGPLNRAIPQPLGESPQQHSGAGTACTELLRHAWRVIPPDP